MPILVVPHTVSSDHVRLWLGHLGVRAPHGFDLTLTPGRQRIHVPGSQWTQVDAAGTLPESDCFVQVVQVRGLRPGTQYRVKERGGGSARFYTLPNRIPTVNETPFSLLLGSCFFRGRDKEGRVGATFRRLPVDSIPRVKVLTGDQVYLDLREDIALPVEPLRSAEYARHCLQKYRRAWFQPVPSFQSLLRHGGAFLTADDHEFWNNSPNWQPHLPVTWTASGRKDWQRTAMSLFKAFQSDDPRSTGSPRQFAIGRLSFFVVDTRVDRGPGDQTFMRGCDFNCLTRWLNASSDPGVLVLSQPIFQRASGWFAKRLKDRTLANYAQYEELVRAIFRSRRSLLVLSGDVHYGRVTTATLRTSGRERRLHEVISSPLSLLHHTDSDRGKAPPSTFPDDAIRGIPRVETRTLCDTGREHFAILQIFSQGGRVGVNVRYWFTKARHQEPPCSRVVGPLYLD